MISQSLPNASELATSQAANSPNSPRILQLAYTCIPNRGSEPGTGWNHAVEAAKHFETWVIVGEEESNQGIHTYLEKNGPIPRLHFEYVPETWLERSLAKIPGIQYLAYSLWNRRAAKVARQLHEVHQFELLHQVTLTGFREPGYLWTLDAPFVWGPIGGAQNYPWRFLSKAGPIAASFETARSIANELQLRFSPRVRRAARRAALLLAGTTTNQRAFARHHRVTPVLLPDTGVRKLSVPETRPRQDDTLRILWCGMLSPRKALHLLLEALAQVPSGTSWELHVVGFGPYRRKWQRLAHSLGIADRIHWLGWISHDDALAQFSWADVFVFSSLRDTTGTVLLESLAAGVPVICLDHQGAADVIDRSCGRKIAVTNPRQVIHDLADNIQLFAQDRDLRDSLSHGAVQRADYYLWGNQGRRLAGLYRQVIAESRAKGEAVRKAP